MTYVMLFLISGLAIIGLVLCVFLESILKEMREGKKPSRTVTYSSKRRGRKQIVEGFGEV